MSIFTRARLRSEQEKPRTEAEINHGGGERCAERSSKMKRWRSQQESWHLINPAEHPVLSTKTKWKWVKHRRRPLFMRDKRSAQTLFYLGCSFGLSGQILLCYFLFQRVLGSWRTGFASFGLLDHKTRFKAGMEEREQRQEQRWRTQADAVLTVLILWDFPSQIPLEFYRDQSGK